MRYFFILIYLMSFFSIAQHKALQLTNNNTEKTKNFKENKRVKIKTTDGKKIKGLLFIIDNETIKVGEQILSLDSIVKIKRNPLLMNIIVATGFVYAGALTMSFGTLIALLGNSQIGLQAILVGSAIFTTGILSPNILKGYSSSAGWHFEVIDVLE